MAVKSIKKAFNNKSTYKTPKKNKYTKKGAGIKYVGREVISGSKGKRQIEFKPVINEIMNLMSNEKSRMNILSLHSLTGFLYTLEFKSEIPLFRSDIVDEDNNKLELKDRISFKKGKEVNEVVLKLIISDENDDDLSIPLKINGNEYYKSTETQDSILSEINNQETIYDNSFRLAGEPFIPNVIGSAILSSIEAKEFLKSYTGRDNKISETLQFIKLNLNLKPKRGLGVIIMEKIPGELLSKVITKGNNTLKENVLSQAAAEGVIILATTKIAPVDAHYNNWLYDNVTKNVSAIDFGRCIVIEPQEISIMIDEFLDEKWEIYFDYFKRNKTLFMEQMADLIDVELSDIEFIEHKTEEHNSYKKNKEIIINKFLSITNEIKKIHPSCIDFYSPESKVEVDGKWYTQPRMQLIHKLLIFWGLIDGISNANNYDYPYIQIRTILNELWGHTYATNIYELTKYMIIDLKKYIEINRKYGNFQQIEKIKKCYELIANIIENKTKSQQNISLRIPKQLKNKTSYSIRESAFIIDDPDYQEEYKILPKEEITKETVVESPSSQSSPLSSSPSTPETIQMTKEDRIPKNNEYYNDTSSSLSSPTSPVSKESSQTIYASLHSPSPTSPASKESSQTTYASLQSPSSTTSTSNSDEYGEEELYYAGGNFKNRKGRTYKNPKRTYINRKNKKKNKRKTEYKKRKTYRKKYYKKY